MTLNYKNFYKYFQIKIDIGNRTEYSLKAKENPENIFKIKKIQYSVKKQLLTKQNNVSFFDFSSAKQIYSCNNLILEEHQKVTHNQISTRNRISQC